MKILVHADFATTTGFATVSQNVVKQLAKDQHDFDIVAINYFGQPTHWQKYFPKIRLFPADRNKDVFGRGQVISLLRNTAYDYIWQVQDTFVIEPIANEILHNKHQTKWIFYYPIDATPKPGWIKAVTKADIPVAYTQYGYDESVRIAPELANSLKIIPHGTDVSVFQPLPDDVKQKFREEYFGPHSKKFILTNVNRNQPRKDIPRSLQLIKKVREKMPEAILYLHCRVQDMGGNIHEFAKALDLVYERDYLIPQNLREQTFSPAELNKIYNISDRLVTTANGEGWGLSITEAMAAKLPVIAPDHTSFHDILADGRGVLIPCEDIVFMSNDNERPRVRTNIDLMAEAIWEKRSGDVEKAYQHVQDNWTWDKVGDQWRALVK